MADLGRSLRPSCRVWSHLIILDPLMRQTPVKLPIPSVCSLVSSRPGRRKRLTVSSARIREIVVVDVGSPSTREEWLASLGGGRTCPVFGLEIPIARDKNRCGLAGGYDDNGG